MPARTSNPERSKLVAAMPWDDFTAHMRVHWKQGQHVALIGPTGQGKSTVAAGLLSATRKYVLALDPKGGDSTLSTLRKAGFERTPSWPPPPKIRRRIEKGEATRLIVGPVAKERGDLPRIRSAMAGALDDAFDQGGWTVYVDELQVAADPRLMALGAPIERLLISARDKGVSVVSSFQRPARVPPSASDQSTWLLVFYTRDRDTVNRLSEMAGRPRPEIRGIVSELRDYAFAVFSRDPRQPVIITRAPRA